jgi:hypothetical protein
MTTWEYLIVELPSLEVASNAPGASAAVRSLNTEGENGWEAVGLTPLADGRIAVLLKRPRARQEQRRQDPGAQA